MIKDSNENPPQKQSRFLTVQQAAEYLGVHAGTIRRWAYTKHLKGTKIGVRGDWRFTQENLLKIANSDEYSNTNPLSNATMSPSQIFDWTKLGDTGHSVQFYEDDAYLVKIISQFISTGDTALVITSPSHKKALEEKLQQNGLDLIAEQERGKYLCLDAKETLSKFIVNGMPDTNLFFEVIGSLLKRSSMKKQKTRVFGEMVALLWAEGNHDAALKLEELWNEIQKTYSFLLFCAYPIHSFNDDSHSLPFEQIEQIHSHVLPSESYSALTYEAKQLREIARLQQRAQALKAEIANHKKTTDVLLETVTALKFSEAFNRGIIENSADCIKVLDLDGNLITMNQPGCEIFEIDDITHYEGKNFRIFWEGSYLTEASKAIERAKNGKIGRFQGFCATAKGNPKWWDIVITPIYGDNGGVSRLLAISRDITAIKELEQRKENFLGATSHELKTPLTSQKAFIQLLQQQIEKNNGVEYARYVTKINEQTDKLTTLVNDLLDVSKIKDGKLSLAIDTIDINECVSKAVEEVQSITDGHKISIKGKISKRVYGDKERISQVIVNLLTNSVKYSPNSNRIDVILHSDKKHAHISVRDFGIGINKKDQHKIFDRFYRGYDNVDNTYPGLGMGLYLASEIIKQHGGTISVTSTKGEGSTFLCTIPFTKTSQL